ncbi:hypothetical protein KIH41_10515 [Litoribacter ruber]|uniref:hypothetical protein n=1 Tax=Litoribacter ruber TaxID=702568 RepID=UPI001BD9E9FF|nr:hypothetical protein [Litoribacter ruber]MBT0811709.1 hypothetical protein [Litoribacter ruber]
MVHHFSFDTDSISGEYLDRETVNKDLTRLSHSLTILSNDSIGYTVLPFKANGKTKKTFEILIYHKSSLNKLLSEKSEFFLRRGIIPGDNIEKILALYEFEDKYDRFKAYGHLFGYPDHAVDFFVESAKHQDNGGEFVTRDFYQIPVANGQEGRFVYAVPKDYEAKEIDETLKSTAGILLFRFQQDWEAYEEKTQPNQSFTNLNFLFFLAGQERN